MNKALWKQMMRWYDVLEAHEAATRHELTPDQRHQQTEAAMLGMLTLHIYDQEQSDALASQDAPDIAHRFKQRLQTIHQPGGLMPPEWSSAAIALDDALINQFLGDLNTLDGNRMTPTTLGQVHEGLLTRRELGRGDRPHHSQQRHTRKSQGSYYTPDAVIQFIVQHTVGALLSARVQPSYQPTASENCAFSLPILDPACGGGAFLLAAYQYLLDWHTQQLQTGQQPRSLTFEERQRILLGCIFGVDLDQLAVQVTRVALSLTLLQGHRAQGVTLPDLTRNIQWGNALIGSDFGVPQEDTQQTQSLDWDTAFAEVMHQGGFDGVIGNPPYIDSETMTLVYPEWRRYCTSRYRTARGNWDLFCVFIEKAWQLCRYGGLTSLIVPNKLVSATYAAQARSLLTQDAQLLRVRDYAQVSVFSVAVYPLVYTAQKHPPTSNATVLYEHMQTLAEVERSQAIPYQRLLHPSMPWVFSPCDRTEVWQRLQRDFLPLHAVATVTGAATVAEAYAMQALIQDHATVNEGDLRLVNSGTIDRYGWLWGYKRSRYLGSCYQHPIIPGQRVNQLPPKRQQQAKQPKIIVAGMTQRLECAADLTGGILAGKSTSVVCSTLDLRYLLALLNSHLIHVFFVETFGGNCLQGGYLRVGPPQLRQIPLCLVAPHNRDDQHRYTTLLNLVDQRLQLHQTWLTATQAERLPLQSQMQTIEHQIDQVVYQLYRLSDIEIASIQS